MAVLVIINLILNLNDGMEFFERTPLSYEGKDKQTVMEWFYEACKHELEMAFIKAPGLEYFETYVTIFGVFAFICIMVANLPDFCLTLCRCKKKRGESIHLTLLKDDLMKSAPFKKNPKGQINMDSLIKLHGIIFKHS